MILRAISRFSWRSRVYEIGDEIECPDDVIGNRLITEGHAEATGKGPAASKPITPTADKIVDAEIPAKKAAVKKSSVVKKKNR